jgi:MFS family permease
MFIFSALTLAIFVWAEIRAKDPIIPITFFEVPIFSTTTIIGFLISVGMFGTLLFLPLYVQGVLGFSAANSGAIMTPMMVSFIIAALIAGQLMTRSGKYKLVSLLAAVLMAAGLYLFTRLGVNTAYTTVIIDMLVLGLGIGALLPILNVAVQNAFPYSVMGIVNAAQQFVRSMGAVIAAPILGTVLANTFALKQAIAQLPPSARQAFSDPQSLTNAQTQAAIQTRFQTFGSAGNQLYHQFINAVHQSMATGMRELFIIALFFGIAGLVATFFLPEIPLQQDEFFEEDG